ncbi:diadenylate cyclase [Paenibacillus odorifer]|uniref:DAC domain-containing protein n=1 Tax=Paenibacillus odorifer TaxID=189426 RepID=A0A1R0XZQ1_9BACL|nr:diadenylate cyclase [Paenibacillus odorifer]OMD40477.1 hypothetical protein BSK52_13970 [Paenibacillus odorifer]
MSLKLIENIHKVVYPQLEEMVRKLDERLELKLYAIVMKEDHSCLATSRIKRVLTRQRGEETEVKLENLKDPKDALSKLGLPGLQWDGSVEHLDRYIRMRVSDHSTSAEIASAKSLVVSTGESSTDRVDLTVTQVHTTTSILYPNRLNLVLKGEKFELIYILAIDYASLQVSQMFYEMPQISFLRMTLDYYFSDYYKEDKDNRINEELESKYKENVSGFLQRMARMFMGKIQQCINDDGGEGAQAFSGVEREMNQQYYINMLMEKIEGIATKTYEGESPFGCMLLMSPKLLNDRTGLVKYAIQFEGENGISLDDGRRIRKLLEMTNNENDLFLIADEHIIYGIGEVDWSLLGTDSVFKLEFKGLSRYDLMLIRMKEEEPTDKRVESDEDKKIFKMTTNLCIVSDKLLGVSFKNPEIGQERFDLDLFKRITLATFKDTTVLGENLDKLEKMIKEATKQQSGTMVVITEPDTAKDEIRRLKKQSTPILKTQLNPMFIKHLTAIDGALYCDTDANCHAIGVILDGLSQEHLGDASRGARFNSAYKYLEKLKIDKAPCVIAIISEDGMVNLIPEPITERTVRQIVKEYVDYIKETEKGKTTENKVKAYEERLQQARGAVEIDDDYLYHLGDAWFEHEDYFKSAEYYHGGIKLSNQLNIDYRRKLISANYKCILELEGKERIPVLENMLDTSNYIIDYGGTELTHEDYNRRGIAQYTLGIYCEDFKKKDGYYKRALEDYTQSIVLKTSRKWVLYSNRGGLNYSMERYEDALDDFISAELEKSSDNHLTSIMKTAGKSSELLIHAITRYSERKGDDWEESKLGKQLMELGEQWSTAHPEVAAAIEELKGDNSPPKDPSIEGE